MRWLEPLEPVLGIVIEEVELGTQILLFSCQLLVVLVVTIQDSPLRVHCFNGVGSTGDLKSC